jgi:DNA-binding response OmpR family regulator
MVPQRNKIMVVSHDPRLAEIRKSVLESAGFRVIPAKDLATVRKVCQKQRVHLVMIGYSVPPAHKRKVWDEARKVCNVPILELHKESGPELMERAFFHYAEAPDDFLASVMKIVRQKLQN